MLLATIVLLGALPQSSDLAKSVANLPAEAVEVSEAPASRTLPSAPAPKIKAEALSGAHSASEANAAGSGKAGVSVSTAIEPPVAALPMQPMKPAFKRERESRGQRIAWYTLAVTGHGAAAFDAYSTRRALSGNYGTESNPLLRPFAHSGALYVATQVSPAVMDYIGKRMMVSENRWVRRMWWLPQAAGSGFSIGAGMHNMSVVK
jgi:hypothetical protein